MNRRALGALNSRLNSLREINKKIKKNNHCKPMATQMDASSNFLETNQYNFYFIIYDVLYFSLERYVL